MGAQPELDTTQAASIAIRRRGFLWDARRLRETLAEAVRWYRGAG